MFGCSSKILNLKNDHKSAMETLQAENAELRETIAQLKLPIQEIDMKMVTIFYN